MKNRFYSFQTLLFVLMLLSARLLPAQWESVPIPGNEYIDKVYNLNGNWVAEGEVGCYRSTNDGLSWSKTLDFSASYGSCTTRSGADIYALDADLGLYRSSNQGLTWNHLSTQMPGGMVYPDGMALTDNYIIFETYNSVYRFDKANPGAPVAVLDLTPLYYPNTLLMQVQGNDVWVAAKDSLLHSTDEGSTWSLVYEGHRAKGFAMHGDTIMVITSAGVQRSVDKGINWSLIYPSTGAEGVFWKDGQWFFRIYTNDGDKITYSTDSGQNWQSFSPLLDNTYNAAFDVGVNGNTTLLATSAGIFRSTDGGNYWEQRNSGFKVDPFSFFDAPVIYAVGNYITAGYSASEDDGDTWFQPLVDAYNLGYPYTLFNGKFFAVDYYQKLYRSDGDVRHWQNTGIQFATGTLSHVLKTDGANFFMFEYDGWNGGNSIIYKSVDEGQTWTPTGGTVYSPYGVVSQNGYLFEWRGFLGLFRSQNGGVTWQSVGAGLNDLAQGSGDVTIYSDGSHLFAYDYNYIMVSSNNGLTFTKINNHLLDNNGFSMVVNYLASDGNIVVAITNERIFMSLGLNDQWVDINANLPFTYYGDGVSVVFHNGYIYLMAPNSDKPLWKRSISSINLAQFQGIVWRDDNNNGQQDSGELLYPGAIVQAGSSSYATSAVDGTYNLFADLDMDTLRVIKPVSWVVANPEFYQVTASESGKNFGLYFPPNITDLKVDLTNQTVFRPGFKEDIYLSYDNVGTANADAVVRFVPYAPLEFQSAFPSPDASSGDTLIWNLQTLNAFSEGKIVISVLVPVGTPLGSLVGAFADVAASQTDENPVDNQAFLSEPVFGAYDPNDKRCSADQISPEQIAAGEALTYTIRFQNTGTYPAEFVRISDTLDYQRLDLSTLQVLASSHPVQTSLRGSGVLEFLFDPIDLPPSDFNEPASHGFVKYSVRPKQGLALGQQIQNTAYIYFDFNAAIVTNTTETGVAETLGALNPVMGKQSQDLMVSPNPSTGWVQIQTGVEGLGMLRVLDGTGRVVFEKNNCANFEKVNLGGIPCGQYLLDWRSETGRRLLGKLVKTK